MCLALMSDALPNSPFEAEKQTETVEAQMSAFSEEESPPTFGENVREAPRGRMLRRLGTLLLTALVAFGLTTWVMVRVEDPAALLGLGPGPSSVVRTHLNALNRGDLREAYAQFSDKYRGKFPFDEYHELVTSHWRIFHTRKASLREMSENGGRAMLEAEMLGSDGRRYVARFTLVRAAKRWWIDDVRWGAPASDDGLIRTKFRTMPFVAQPHFN